MLQRATGSPLSLSLTVAVLATVSIAAQGAGRATDVADRATNVFEDKARVIAVEIPVTVTDKSGAPVRGLTAEDFVVLDEGAERQISGFEVVDLGTSEGGETGVLTPNDLPSSARRHFLLLFDISFSDPSSVLKARVAAREFALRHLHPTDLVAVATYSLETGPRLVLTFTPDRAQVAHAIDSLGLHHTAEIDPLRFLISPVGRPGQDSSTALASGLPNLTSGAQGALQEALQVISEQMDRSERSFHSSQITYFARSMGEMARVLASVSGRKHVVFFSEGFDSRLLTGNPITDDGFTGDNRTLLLQRGNLWRIDSDDLYGSTGLQRKLREMVTEFRRADAVIQAVDIGGLRAEANIRGDQPLDSGHEGLFYMANETGGELFKDANNLEEQLREVLERNSVTYVLTFEPTDLAFDGRFHRLKVKLNGRRDARLSHRQGYYEPRPFAQLHPLEKDLLAADAIASAVGANDLGLNVLAASFRATEEWAYVPVIVEVQGEDLLAGHRASLLPVEIYAYATTGQGEMVGFFTERLTVDLEKAERSLTDGGLKYYGHLELPEGSYRVRVLVRNSLTGHAAVETVPLEVPAYAEQSAVVLPPFFLEEPGQWLMVRERPSSQGSESTIYPFTVKGEPYVPAVKPRLLRGRDARLCVVAYNLGRGDLRLEGEVHSADGRQVDGGRLELVERTTTGIEGYDKVLASFHPSGLAAGEYTLRVALTEHGTGRSQVNSIPFSVFN